MNKFATPLAATSPIAQDADRSADTAAALPQDITAAGTPQPIDAELLKFIGGAGLYDSPVNRW